MEWISVKDRLPGTDVDVVLHYTMNGHDCFQICFIRSGIWFTSVGFGLNTKKCVPVNWLHLPELPK